MNARFQHFLLTRFNVPWSGRLHLEPDWLDGRFALFDRFCCPSVMSQSNDSFRWLLFSHSETPEPYSRRLQEYARQPNIRIVVSPTFDVSTVQAALRDEILPITEYVITSRLDSDDAIACDYIERLQNHFRARTEFLNFRHGYVWSEGKVYQREYLSNPFVSLIEPATELRTVFCEQHWCVARTAPLVQIAGDPAWLQVVHGNNVANHTETESVEWLDATALQHRFCIRTTQ